jgi:peptidoglycan/LPS O-acetylase OafA/YrhL
VIDRDVPPAYRPDIDGLRAIAVLAVVGFHAFPRLDPGGFVGVDIFFVISGFLISTIILAKLASHSFSFQDFYARRARRIFPALLAVLAACLVAGWVLLLPFEYKELGKQIVGAAGFASNFLLWHEAGYFDASGEAKPLLHLWSLGVEEQFYLLWPLLLFFSRGRRGLMLAGTALLALASFAYSLHATHHAPGAAFFSPASRWWELMAGGLLAQLVAHRGVLGGAIGNVASLTGLALIAATLLLLDQTQAFPGWWALAPVLGTFLVLFAGPTAWLNRVVLSNRALVGCGLISYPLYLWHWPLISFAWIYRSAPPTVAMRIGAVALAFVLSWATYMFIERPIRFGGRGRRTALALLALLAVTGAVGGAVYAGNGLGFRPVLGQVRPAFVPERPEAPRKPCADLASLPAPLAASCYSHVNPGMGRKVVVWGDSQARVWTADFEKLARRDGFELFVFLLDGCPPLDGVRRSDIQDSLAACGTLETTHALFEAIVGLHPDIVTLVARWSLYSHGWIRNGELLKANGFLMTQPGGTATRDSSQAALAASIPATVARLQDRKISVMVVKNPPVLNWEVTNLRKSVADLQVSAAEHREFSRFTDEIFGRLQNIELFDPAPALGRTDCRAEIDGRYLYVDDNHLSDFGAGRFESDLGRVLERQLKARN